MLRPLAVAFVLASVTASSAAAPGDLYKCKPPGRSTIVENYPPRECDGIVEIFILSHDGTPKGTIPPRLTDAQKQARDEEKSMANECHAQNEARRRADEGLLERYRSEDELMADRDAVIGRELAHLDQQIRRLESLAADRERLNEEAQFYLTHPMPPSLKVRLEENGAAKAQVEHEQEAAWSRIKAIAADFGTVLARYRALVDGSAKYPCERPIK
jgi:hypothetical protein